MLVLGLQADRGGEGISGVEIWPVCGGLPSAGPVSACQVEALDSG